MYESDSWKREYLKDDFAVDMFLTKYIQKTDLASLRRELKNYATELHNSMSEILKMETEAIVNLAENLTNLNTTIEDLSSPIFQLREEIKLLFDVTKSAEQSFEFYLKNIRNINAKHDYLHTKMIASSTSMNVLAITDSMKEGNQDLIFLERGVTEYAFQNSYISEMKLDKLQAEISVNEIGSKLKIIIDEKLIDALKSHNENVLVCCLRMYVNLKLQNEAERIYRNKIVFPVLDKVFTKRNLENHKHNLNSVFQEALNFLNFDMAILHEILKKNTDLKGYNFIINSYWSAVDKLLRENLPNITAPGNPELFQRRFQDTWYFLQTIIDKANNPTLIYEKSFQQHFKRFNLPVYFEIRFQQISATLETEIQKNANIQTIQKNDDNSQFKLKVTSIFWRCIDMCFHPEVFLDHLSDQFIKCSMLLLSRYLCWLETLLSSLAVGSSFELFLVNSLIDLNILKNCIGISIKDVIGQSIYRIISQKLWPLVLKIVDINEKSLNDTYKKFQMHLVTLKVQQSANMLQHVGSIPRLYRRTNRNIPKDPSNYALEAVSPILKFHTSNKEALEGVILAIMDVCITKLGEQYLSLVQEVLLSVCKTEESLRRLKSRNLNVSEESLQGNTELSSDEAKIREQIRLDVAYFIKHLLPLALRDGQKVLETLAEEAGFTL